MLVYNYKGDYYVTGSFCPYDKEDLKEGAFLGNKIVCAKWGSAFCIVTGTVENGPALRNLSAFPIDLDRKTDFLSIFIPFEGVSAYSRSKIIPKDENSTQRFVILGDTLTTLGAITALRTNYDGEIIIIPNSRPIKGFVNTKFLRESLLPLKKNDQYIVDPEFLQQNYCDILPKYSVHEISTIDVPNKQIIFRDGLALSYSKCLIACGSSKIKNFGVDFENVFELDTVQTHAKVHNAIKNAKTVVIYGSTFESYEVASSVKALANKYGKSDMKVYLLEAPPSEIMRSFDKQVYTAVKTMMYINGISVLSDYKIVETKSLPGSDNLDILDIINEKNQERVSIRPDVVISETNISSSNIPLNQIYM